MQVIAPLGAYDYNATPLLHDLTDGEAHHGIMIRINETFYWNSLTVQQDYVEQSQVLLSSATLLDRESKTIFHF